MSSQPATILVVDDSPVDRLLAGRLLQKAGMAVEFATDGGKAISSLMLLFKRPKN